jgi:hypothetical protein
MDGGARQSFYDSDDQNINKTCAGLEAQVLFEFILSIYLPSDNGFSLYPVLTVKMQG